VQLFCEKKYNFTFFWVLFDHLILAEHENTIFRYFSNFSTRNDRRLWFVPLDASHISLLYRLSNQTIHCVVVLGKKTPFYLLFLLFDHFILAEHENTIFPYFRNFLTKHGRRLWFLSLEASHIILLYRLSYQTIHCGVIL
jgi:hypothetical protein